AGNPLLIRLLAEALVSSPAEADSRSVERMIAQRPDLRRLVTARADMLSAPARKILQAASVLGERVAPLELAAVTDLTSAAIGGLLEEAVGAGILRAAPDAPGLAFTHALVRDAVYADLTASARSHWHRRSAVALETIEGLAAAGRIAMHWHQATGPDAADHCSRWASLAAEQARNALAFDEAAQFAAMATERAQLAGDDGRLAELTLELAHAQFANTAIEESLSSCVDAAELAERAGRPDLVAAAGLVVHGIGAPDINRTIGRLCQRALRHPGLTDQTVRARLLAQLAVAEAVNGGGPSAADLAAKALTAAEETGDPDAVLEAIAARHLAISTPSSVVERLELGRRAVELGGASKQPIAAVWGHLWRVDAAFQLGNLAEVERELAEIDRIARTRRSGLARWHHHRLIATRSALLGDFAEARAHTIAARDLAERMGDASLTGMFYAFCSELAHTRGDPTELPANWLELNPSTPDIPLIQLAKCSWQLLIGRRDEARAEFEQFRGLPTTMPVGVRWAPTLGLIASIAVELRDSTVAEQVFELLAPTAVYYGGDGSGVAFSHGSNARVVADVALVAGRRDDALRYYVDAVDMNARIGARPFTALSRLGWARALLTPPASAGLGSPPGQHDLRLARELADQAAAEFRRLDMPGPLAAASALLADLDMLGRNPNPLTVRESEIVTLIAGAMSNKDIAARLFVSERTVETHVRHILGKLGFASRTEIATWAVLHQP
ncbi:MAG: LuxR C-terminal-related transcriptional regulator, partial [Nakamurella sp.]